MMIAKIFQYSAGYNKIHKSISQGPKHPFLPSAWTLSSLNRGDRL